jgi:hypothetical protein
VLEGAFARDLRLSMGTKYAVAKKLRSAHTIPPSSVALVAGFGESSGERGSVMI